MRGVRRCEDLQVGQEQRAAAAVPASQASHGGGRRMCFTVSWRRGCLPGGLNDSRAWPGAA